jgi:filamentous hemagglutinin family protein
MFGRLHKLLLATTALMPLGLAPAFANPLGAQVAGGNASVQGQGTANVTVTQSTNNAIINWNTFNIGANEKTQFIQPNSSSVALNRVTGGLGPSQIFGTLSANGQIFVVNPDGILVGPGAKIDTAGFLATTHDIANADFMAGRYNFSIPGNPSASVINQGTITAQSGGFAALVAPGVRNTGTITANLGTVVLASGNGFTLDFYGDKLITLGVSDSIAAQVTDVSTGQPLASLVSNTGKLKANGGIVELTAVAARQVVDSVINNTGVIEANSIATRNGMIVLSAATAASKPADAPTQTVKISGKLSAAGNKKGTKGGTIEVTGEAITLTGAKLDASGRSGGGTVLIGGDVGGGNPSPAVGSIPQAQLQPYAVPTASTVTVDAATTINASAKDIGDGGKVVVWSDQATSFDGTILARGGTNSGDGGFVETSGHQLAFNGTVDTSAPYGLYGTLLLDPFNVTISSGTNTNGSISSGTLTPSGNDSILNATTLQNALASNNVTVTTGSSGSQSGDITVAAPVSWSSASTLALNANRQITINAAITGTSGGLSLNAGTDQIIRAAAAVQVHTFTLQNGDWFQVTNNLPVFSATDFRITGGSFLRALGGDGSSGSPFQITDIYGLQGIGSPSTSGLGLQHLVFSNYVLTNNIAAAGTAQWNSGAGFVPIGYGGFDPPYTTFGGIFDGQNHTIDGLTINSSATVGSIGLFAGNYGTIRNLNLTNLNYTINNAAYIGGLVGTNNGTISNVSVSGTLNVGSWSGSNNISLLANAGGLVGSNVGTISGSSSSGLLTGNAPGDSAKGGLVGQNTWVEYFDINGNLTSTVIGTISNSSSSMTVQGLANGSIVGGLVGWNNGVISQSSASGTVTTAGGILPSQSGAPFTIGEAGGLVGLNYNLGPPDVGLISNSSATGSVTGGPNSQIGPLVGLNYGGTITNSSSSSSTSTQAASASFAQLFGQTNNLLASSALSDADGFFSALGNAAENALAGIGAAIANLYPAPNNSTSQTTTPAPSSSNSVVSQAIQTTLSQLIPDPLGTVYNAAEISATVTQFLSTMSERNKNYIDQWLQGACSGQACTVAQLKDAGDNLSNIPFMGVNNLSSAFKVSSMSRDQYVNYVTLVVTARAAQDGYSVK